MERENAAVVHWKIFRSLKNQWVHVKVFNKNNFKIDKMGRMGKGRGGGVNFLHAVRSFLYLYLVFFLLRNITQRCKILLVPSTLKKPSLPSTFPLFRVPAHHTPGFLQHSVPHPTFPWLNRRHWTCVDLVWVAKRWKTCFDLRANLISTKVCASRPKSTQVHVSPCQTGS